MEKFNLNFSDDDNIIKSIFWIFSVLGWIMYLICGWISLYWLEDDYYNDSRNNYNYGVPIFLNAGYVPSGEGLIMTIIRRGLYKYGDYTYGLIYPLQLQTSVLFIIVILTMVFALFAFIVYMIKSTCKKEKEVFDGMLGDYTRIHSEALFFASGLFLIGICLRDKNYNNRTPDEIWDDWKDGNIAGIVLVILGLIGLIFIYIKTDLPDDWLTASIKKGAYSTLIALEWYYFCYIICNLVIIDHKDKSNKWLDYVKVCGIVMPIIEGIGALVFAFFYKDVIIAFMNVLIFAGAMGYYLSIHKDFRKDGSGGHGVAEGIIDLVFLVLSIVVILLLIIMKKDECLK